MNKKGQAQHILMYMLAMIVIGLIVLLGYRAVAGFVKNGCEVKELTFKKDLLNFVEKYKTYGSVRTQKITAPCDVSEICFLNNSASLASGVDPIIEDYTNNLNQEQRNVFLMGKRTDPYLFIEDLYPKNGKLECINAVDGFFEIKFEGKGSSILVSNS